MKVGRRLGWAAAVRDFRGRLIRAGQALSWDSLLGFIERRGWRVLQGVVALIVLVWACSNLHVIAPDEQAVVTRFGRFRDQLSPGLHWRLPPPLETVYRIRPFEIRSVGIGLDIESVTQATAGGRVVVAWETIHALQPEESTPQETLFLTGDEVLAAVSAVIHYRVQPDRLRRFMFAAQDPQTVLQSIGEHALRSSAARRNLDNLLTDERRLLESETLAEVRQLVERYDLGVEIVDFAITDLHPPLEVVPDYREVASALEHREQLMNDAKAYSYREVIRAGGHDLVDEIGRIRGDDSKAQISVPTWRKLLSESGGGRASAILQSAHQDRENRSFGADGDAQRFLKRQEAFRHYPWLTKTRLFWETTERVLRNRRKVILDPTVVKGRRLFLLDPDQMMPPVMGAFPPNADEEFGIIPPAEGNDK